MFESVEETNVATKELYLDLMDNIMFLSEIEARENDMGLKEIIHAQKDVIEALADILDTGMV